MAKLSLTKKPNSRVHNWSASIFDRGFFFFTQSGKCWYSCFFVSDVENKKKKNKVDTVSTVLIKPQTKLWQK